MMNDKESDNLEGARSRGPAALRESLRRRSAAVRQTPFAGRIGGNQEFVADGDDEDTEELLKKQPDAVSQV